MTQLLKSQLALMKKTGTTIGMKYMKGVFTAEHNFTGLLELKVVEIGKLQIMKKQVVTSALNYFLL